MVHVVLAAAKRLSLSSLKSIHMFLDNWNLKAHRKCRPFLRPWPPTIRVLTDIGRRLVPFPAWQSPKEILLSKALFPSSISVLQRYPRHWPLYLLILNVSIGLREYL